MPTRVEELLKKIHVLFAKGECYQNSPDLVILSKSEMFDLLTELNEAIYEVLDQYEATTRSKALAKLETEREASEIIAAAKRDADDVHAASLMYTDTMLDELNNVVEQTKQSIRSQYLEMLSFMDLRQEAFNENRSTIKDQLTELHDSESYISMLEELRKKEEEKKSEDGPKEEEWPVAPVKNDIVEIRVNRPGENTGVTITNRHNRNKKKTQPEKQQQVTTMSEEELSALPKEERERLENSSPAFGMGYKAEDFNLDQEWEAFKAEQEGEQEGEVADRKRGKWRFGKKKK